MSTIRRAPPRKTLTCTNAHTHGRAGEFGHAKDSVSDGTTKRTAFGCGGADTARSDHGGTRVLTAGRRARCACPVVAVRAAAVSSPRRDSRHMYTPSPPSRWRRRRRYTYATIIIIVIRSLPLASWRRATVFHSAWIGGGPPTNETRAVAMAAARATAAVASTRFSRLSRGRGRSWSRCRGNVNRSRWIGLRRVAGRPVPRESPCHRCRGVVAVYVECSPSERGALYTYTTLYVSYKH